MSNSHIPAPLFSIAATRIQVNLIPFTHTAEAPTAYLVVQMTAVDYKNLHDAFSNRRHASYPSDMEITKWILGDFCKRCRKHVLTGAPQNRKEQKSVLVVLLFLCPMNRILHCQETPKKRL